MGVHYLGDNGPDGTVLGYDETEKIGFFGATPVVKQTSAAFANVGTSLDVLGSSLTVSFGLNGSQAAQTVLDTINAIVETLNTYGLLADA